MLGEPIYRKVLHAEDIGTRLTHMMELQQIWSDVYGILTTDHFHTELEQIRAIQLGIALDLLQHHLEAEFNMTNYAKDINEGMPKWSDRLERIAKCMDELARIRATFGKKNPEAVGAQIGQCDWLEELHRLLYDWEAN